MIVHGGVDHFECRQQLTDFFLVLSAAGYSLQLHQSSLHEPVFGPIHQVFIVADIETLTVSSVSYVSKVELDADEEWELNRRLGILHVLTANSRLSRANAVDITVEYYSVCTDRENDAYMEKGQYLTVTGRVVRVDPHTQELKLISDGSALVIRFSDIYSIKDPADSIF